MKISLFVLSFPHVAVNVDSGRLDGSDGICWWNKYQLSRNRTTSEFEPSLLLFLLQHIQTLHTSTSTLRKLWFHVFNNAFSSFWTDIRLSSLWKCSVVETYVGQPPQQMSNSRLQHATSAAIPTSPPPPGFTAQTL